MKKLNKKYTTYVVLAIAFSSIGLEALAAPSGAVVDSAAQLTPLYDKILGALSGTLGKIIMGIGVLLGGVAALAGMNKAMVFTPIGTGIFLGNAKALIDWVFGS